MNFILIGVDIILKTVYKQKKTLLVKILSGHVIVMSDHNCVQSVI